MIVFRALNYFHRSICIHTKQLCLKYAHFDTSIVHIKNCMLPISLSTNVSFVFVSCLFDFLKIIWITVLDMFAYYIFATIVQTRVYHNGGVCSKPSHGNSIGLLLLVGSRDSTFLCRLARSRITCSLAGIRVTFRLARSRVSCRLARSYVTSIYNLARSRVT